MVEERRGRKHFAVLVQDGITTGAIYALLSLALVLIFR